jgi:Tol biopolymer transport system component
MTLDGADLTRLDPDACYPSARDHDWTPTGSTLVAAATLCQACFSRLWVLSPGETPTQLTQASGASDLAVSISPDGAVALFARRVRSRSTVWSVNLDGIGATQLTFAQAEHGPAWLPDPP